ncbi:MAG TPA: FtsX-like permease family protein [Myxococcota bacterium]|nr:FtsX-like permease family protein [Myxococcota bacterium]
MNTLRIGWRSIWRNKRRTAITAAAVALNTAILIVSYGLMDGMIVDTVHSVTNMLTGDAQLHAPGYRADRSFYKSVQNVDQVLLAARQAGIDASPRSYGYGLVSVGHKSAGARFWGIDPRLERKVFGLAGQMSAGEFISERREAAGDSETVGRDIVLGRKLAKSLHAVVGSEIVAVVQAGDGSLGNELFTVKGVLKSVGEEVDRAAAIIDKRDFEDLFVSKGRIHEVAFNAHGRLTPEQVVAALKPATAGMELFSWKQLLPALADMVNMFDAAIWIFGMIFFLAAGLGVMNTMLMATYERMREFGMLKAMGATPWRIIRDVSAEALMLALFSTAIGLAIGIGADVYFHAWGIDLSGLGGDVVFSGIAFNPIWRATITTTGVIAPVVVMWLVCLLAALWPASKAARLDPVRAINHV